MTVPLRAVLYLRVSTARQAEHDISIPDQKRQGEAYSAPRPCSTTRASKAITPQMVRTFTKAARQRIRFESGGYCRDHLRALAQRVEVADGEVRIMGSKTRLLQALTGKSGVNSVPTQGLKWRRG